MSRSTTPYPSPAGRRRHRRAGVAGIVAALALPGQALAESLVIRGGTVHPMAGEAFVGHVVIENGLIAAVGPNVPTPAGATTIDASGLHVYPGVFDALSQLGLIEVGSVSATDDQAEMGMYNPHLDAATAIHPASEVIPVTRANGVTHTLVAPEAGRDGVIAGCATLVHLDGWTVEEMAVQTSAAMVIQWPTIVTRSFDTATFSVKETPFTEAKEKATKQQNELRDWFDAARQYRQASQATASRAERDLKLAALAECLEGKKQVIIVAQAKRDIEAAVKFADQEGLRLILAGGRDAWEVKGLLAEKKIPVILGFTESLPAEDDDPYDRPFRNAGELAGAGVKIAFASGAGGGFGPGGPHASRTIPYEAAVAAANGLGDENALRAITLWPAEILGIADKMGSIQTGKIANLIVTDSTPLEISTKLEHLIIRGREVSTANRHSSLYEKYSSRPAR